MMSNNNRPAAFITGSGRGIGKGIALALADKGFSIALNSVANLEALHATERELKKKGADVIAIPGDISDIKSHDELLAKAEDAIGPLSTLVNNAGVSVLNRGDLLDVTEESYDRCLNVNAKGAFFLAKAFAGRVLSRSERSDAYHSIINVTSVNAVAASINRIEYCMSKAAASMMSKTLAVRLAKEGIMVFELQPGLIKTDMSKPAWELYQRRIEEEELTLISRMGTAEDMGTTVATLATGGLPYITGQPIMADAGLLIPRF